jgi:hypothetical protein
MTIHINEPFTTGTELWLAAREDEDTQTVDFSVDVSLWSLIEGDNDTLNDTVEGMAIAGEGYLEDISYAVVSSSSTQYVRLHVTATVIITE